MVQYPKKHCKALDLSRLNALNSAKTTLLAPKTGKTSTHILFVWESPHHWRLLPSILSGCPNNFSHTKTQHNDPGQVESALLDLESSTSNPDYSNLGEDGREGCLFQGGCLIKGGKVLI